MRFEEALGQRVCEDEIGMEVRVQSGFAFR